MKGAQVFYYGGSAAGEYAAGLIQDRLVKELDPENHRTSRANDSYYLLKKTGRPLVIVECGFLSNPEEAARLSDDYYQEKLALAHSYGADAVSESQSQFGLRGDFSTESGCDIIGQSGQGCPKRAEKAESLLLCGKQGFFLRIERRNDMKTLYEVMDGSSRDKREAEKSGRDPEGGRSGGLPTETVYGLGGDALNPESSRKIYAAKGRPSDNPLIVHICRLSDLEKIAWDPDGKGLKVARAFWPGPLTMILKKKETVPLETTGGLPTVAVRFPSHPVARGLIDAAGGFIAAPSANTSGKPSPTSARYVAEDMDGRIDMILDGGDVGIGLESTIVDLYGGRAHDPQARLCDTGDADGGSWQRFGGPYDPGCGVTQRPKAPGMKYRHYAPKGDLAIVEGEPERGGSALTRSAKRQSGKVRKTGVIATDETASLYLADSVKSVGSRQDEEAIAHSLYRILREFDDEGVRSCIRKPFPYVEWDRPL